MDPLGYVLAGRVWVCAVQCILRLEMLEGPICSASTSCDALEVILGIRNEAA